MHAYTYIAGTKVRENHLSDGNKCFVRNENMLSIRSCAPAKIEHKRHM